MQLCFIDFHMRKDHGYAWVVLVGCIILNFLNIGFLFGSIGVLTFKYVHEFGVDTTISSWAGAILFLILFICGPLAAFIVGKAGVRVVAVVSTVVNIVGFCVSGFAEEFWHVILSFAVFSGFACSCNHVCVLKILTVYFEKHQHTVYAVSAVGSDLAAVTFPFITSKIMDWLPYKYSIFFLSAILSLGVPFAFTFIEPTSWELSNERRDSDNEELKDSASPDSVLLKTTEVGQNNNVDEKLREDESGSINDELENCKLYMETTERCESTEESHTLKDHLNLLTTPKIMIYLLNAVLWNMGGSVISVLAYSFYTEDAKLNDDAASLGYTMFGVGSLCGSLALAAMSSFCNLNRLYIHFLCNLSMGVVSIVFPLLSFSEVGMTTCLALIGIGYGMICANLGSTIQHLNGSNLLYLVYGYEMAAAGIGSFIGPIVGSRLDKAIYPGAAYFFAGASHLFALLIFVIFAFIKREILKPLQENGAKVT